ncbi:hypothetical protein RchiOBHm_Chr1g0377131 [Rosa chinensis]|uniref:Uncharacterized protein n=1 Tax=Rosa chinensis TaxID=74649 RepID=A0A2P6SN44_ROSCH|nr:hypothetical protein RchiOBHm_Chr1g0377131 [Rosa chinensis]
MHKGTAQAVATPSSMTKMRQKSNQRCVYFSCASFSTSSLLQFLLLVYQIINMHIPSFPS